MGFGANAQLSAGDIAFVGYNTDGTDDFSWIALTDIPGGEVIYFTEEGWAVGANTWAGTTEGHMTYTAPGGGISCGTVVHINETAANVFTVTGGGTAVLSTGSWSLSAGDQVLAYQAATPEPATVPTFISGIHGDDGQGTPTSLDATTGWNSAAVIPLGNARSQLPAGLTNGVDCISLFPAIGTEQDNARYNGTLTGTSTALRASINDRTNWINDNGIPYNITPGSYSPSVTCVAACTDPTVPTLTATPTTVCTGGTASLNISGSLNDATAWQVYTGSCGGTNIGSTTTGTFAIPGTITAPTTYFVRGEGGCVTPGSCGSVTITPQALDDASFSYSAATFCVNESDPTPTITGLAGGTFSSAPAGLSINTSTGQIDVSLSTPNTYTVTYTTAGTCPNSSNVSVTINALDDPSFSYSAAAFCANDTDPTPTVTGLAGGSFSSAPGGLSINTTTGQIDASASTPNTYTVTYTTTGACPNSSNVSVTINPVDDASFSYSAASFCVNESDPTPTITGLAGGSFSSAPAGLSINATTGQIDVSLSTPNTYTVSYTTTGTCPASSGVSVTITALDDASFSYSAGTYCQTDTDPTPTITGVTGGSFSSSPAGLSINTTTGQIDASASTPNTYTVMYTTTGACSNSSNVAVTIQGAATSSFTALADLCINAGVQAGLGSGTPTGGVYSGAGVTDDGNGMTYSFDPAAAGVGVHTITYTPAGGCSSPANDNVEVFALPSVTFTALADLCINDGVQAGLGSGSPTGGVYSGAGVTDDGNGTTYSFDPAAAGVGVHTITYTFTNANGCTGSANDNVEVFALPSVTFTALADLCINDGVQAGLGSGTPTGGVYSGPGVTDDGNGMTYSFDPAAAGVGVHTLTYTYSNASGCTNSASDGVEVFAIPTVTYTAPGPFCSTQGVQTALGGGTPTGGVYSGTGVTDDGNGMTYSFDPAAAGIGTHTVTYIVNSGGCVGFASDDIVVSSGGAVNAVCQDVTIFLDANGNATLTASDIDGGSSVGCGTLNLATSQTAFTCADATLGAMPTNDLVITGAYDGPLTGGTPKGVELYVINNIADLSQYGLGSANNGGGTDGEEFTFPAVAATAGQYIYVSSESTEFTNFFGFAPDYTTGAMSINGDDAVELFYQGGVIDVFGDINTDGTGEVWDFQDGWAYRVNDTGNDGSTWTPGNWTYSGINVLDGETSNATAATPFPIGTYSITVAAPTSVTLTVTDGLGGSATCTANVTVLDTISPVANCQDATVYLDGSGNASITAADVTASTITSYTVDQTGTFAPLASPITGTQVNLGDDAVSGALPIGFNFDFYDNTYSNFYISSNGFMTFSPAGSGCCSGQNLPNAAAPNDLIAFAWEDLDPGNGGQPAINLIQYTTIGTAPNRVLVMEFYNVDHFPSGNNVSTQVHLYETSNMIEIHTTNMPTNGDTHTMGIENVDGTLATAVPLRNANGTWSASNDYVAFMPVVAANSDNCGIDTETIDISTFDCSNVGAAVSVTMTVTDNAGNSSTCTSNVTVLDSIAPTVTCPTDIVQDQDPGVCSADVTVPNITTADNCSGETISWTVSGATTGTGTGQPGVQTFSVGLSTVDVTATDASGNTANCSFTVTVNDTVAPTTPVLADSVSDCSVTVVAPTTTDNCAGTITGTTTDPLTYTTQGTSVVTWTFDDGVGNVSTATQNVIISDVTPPTASNIDTVFAECIGDVAIDETLVDDEADNCAVPTVTYVGDVASNGTGCNDTVVRTYNVSDDAGNNIDVTQIIILNDTTAPTASNPLTLNVVCIADVPSTTGAASWVTDEADNCGNPTVTWLSDVSSNGTGCNDTITRTFEVSDACGNAIQVEQLIIVNDDVAPVIDNAALTDAIGYCDVTPATPTATDNCLGSIDGVADVTFPINTIGTTVVTWTYTDDCGNTATQTQNVIVEGVNVNTFFASDGITIVSSNNDAGVTFQWYNCTEDTLMTGETNQNFTPTFSADFAVIVTQDGCVDTSACVTITEVGLDQLTWNNTFTMFPNPTESGSFSIQIEAPLKTVSVLDMTGRIVAAEANLTEKTVDVSKLVNGAYIVRIETENGQEMVGTIRVH